MNNDGIKTFKVLDSRLSYRLLQPDGSVQLGFRGLGDGTWVVATGTAETSLMLNEAGLRRQLDRWAQNGGKIQHFACTCEQCSPPPFRAFQNEVGVVTHGYWPQCLATYLQTQLAEAKEFLCKTRSSLAV